MEQHGACIFRSKSVENPVLATLIAPRLFPQKILDTKVYKTSSVSPSIAVVMIRYKEGHTILTESFCRPILGLASAAKQSVCKLACNYITRNFTLGSINEPDGDQHDDVNDNNVNIGIPAHREGVPAGEPSAI